MSVFPEADSHRRIIREFYLEVPFRHVPFQKFLEYRPGMEFPEWNSYGNF